MQPVAAADNKPARPLITPEEEPGLRLLAFAVALAAIAMRRETVIVADGDKPALQFDPVVAAEAHLMVDAVMEEAKRLEGSAS